MKKLQILTLLILPVFFLFAQNAKAADLTNFSVSSTSAVVAQQNDITFNYTINTADPQIIFFGYFGFGFNIEYATASVSVNGTPRTFQLINHADGYYGGNMAIVLDNPTVPSGAVVNVVISNVYNPPSPYEAAIHISTANGLVGEDFNALNTLDTTSQPTTFNFQIDQASFSGGDGTEGDPYQITTCSQLQSIAKDVSAHYKIMNDIDCAETEAWNPNPDEWVDGIVGGTLIEDEYDIVENNGYFGFIPIDYYTGNEEDGFTGVLDGNNKTISNLWMFRKSESSNGLFKYINEGSVHDLTLENFSIVAGQYTGALAGQIFSSEENPSEINNVHLVNNMVRTYLDYNGGGLVGYLSGGNIENVTNTGGNVHGSGNIIGGLIGTFNEGSVASSSSSADVDGGEYIGGLIGQMGDGTVTDSFATGNVESNYSESTLRENFIKTGQYTGGFVGRMTGGIISNSYATGNVTAERDRAGGFVGDLENATITNSYSTGSVSGLSIVGGFAGGVNSATINNSYSTGTTTSTGDYTGGFVGNISNTEINESYATGEVISTGNLVGGFGGYTSCGSIMNKVYATGDVTGNSQVGGFSGADGCMGPGSTIDQAFASGNIMATGDDVGGFFGSAQDTTITNAYAIGIIWGGNTNIGGFSGHLNIGNFSNIYSAVTIAASNTPESFGGLFGYFTGENTLSNNFWDGDNNPSLNACSTIDGEIDCVTGVTELTTLEATTQSTYTNAGWNFEDIWEISNESNNGYPQFVWQNYVSNDVPPVLTVISAIPERTTISNAVYKFRTSQVCDILAERIETDSSQPAEALIDSIVVGQDLTTTIRGIQVGSTYSFSFVCINENGSSNLLTVGPFTVIANSSGSRSGGSSIRSRIKNLIDSGNTVRAEELRNQFSNVLNTGINNATSTNLSIRDLTLNMTGDDVKSLQNILIKLNIGPAAQALSGIGATGYFGSYTRNALVEYQKKNNIVPSVGYFGPITRAFMKSAGIEGLWW